MQTKFPKNKKQTRCHIFCLAQSNVQIQQSNPPSKGRKEGVLFAPLLHQVSMISSPSVSPSFKTSPPTDDGHIDADLTDHIKEAVLIRQHREYDVLTRSIRDSLYRRKKVVAICRGLNDKMLVAAVKRDLALEVGKNTIWCEFYTCLSNQNISHILILGVRRR